MIYVYIILYYINVALSDICGLNLMCLYCTNTWRVVLLSFGDRPLDRATNTWSIHCMSTCMDGCTGFRWLKHWNWRNEQNNQTSLGRRSRERLDDDICMKYVLIYRSSYRSNVLQYSNDVLWSYLHRGSLGSLPPSTHTVHVFVDDEPTQLAFDAGWLLVWGVGTDVQHNWQVCLFYVL